MPNVGQKSAQIKESVVRSDGVYIWGDIVDAEMVIDLIGFIHQTRRTVVLTIAQGDIRKSIFFRYGDIMAARSTVPDDRFGNIMFREGMISREDLESALAEVKTGRKIGNVLLSRQLISSDDLWRVLKIQITEILYSILTFESGEFTIAVYRADQAPTRTALDTQYVLLEGLRRKDEMKKMRLEMPSMSAVLTAIPSANPSLQIEASEQRVYGLIDGRRSVREVIETSGLGDFGACRAIHRLVKVGLAAEETTVTDRPPLGALTARSALRAFNAAFLRVYAALDRDDLIGSPTTIGSFFGEGSGEIGSLFHKVVTTQDGQLEEEPILSNVGSDAPERLQLFVWGLRDYLRYLLFSAREALPYEEVESLAAEVAELVEHL